MKTVLASVIRQKGESQNGCLKKTKYAKLSKKHLPLETSTYVCARTLFTDFFFELIKLRTKFPGKRKNFY